MSKLSTAIQKSELDRLNELLNEFYQQACGECPNFHLLGMLVAVNENGVCAIPAPNLEYSAFAHILEEMGKWMIQKEVN